VPSNQRVLTITDRLVLYALDKLLRTTPGVVWFTRLQIAVCVQALEPQTIATYARSFTGHRLIKFVTEHIMIRQRRENWWHYTFNNLGSSITENLRRSIKTAGGECVAWENAMALHDAYDKAVATCELFTSPSVVAVYDQRLAEKTKQMSTGAP